MEEILCTVCGAKATTCFVGNPAFPLCSNPVCEKALIDDINGEAQVAAQEDLNEIEVEVK